MDDTQKTPDIPADQPTAKPRRKPGSFVLKLTLSQSIRMFRLFVVVDLLIVLLVAGLTITDTEQTVSELAQLNPAAVEQASRFAYGVRATVEEEPGFGYILHQKLDDAIAVNPGAVRRFVFEPAQGHVFLRNWEVRPQYTVAVPREDGSYLRVAFDMTIKLRRFCYGMCAILVIEVIMLITNTAGARRAVKRTLAPIQQLTMAARNITAPGPQKEPAGVRTDGRKKAKEQKPYKAQKPPELKLSGTIDTLNKITADDLGARIPIESERHELRGLAAAINSMLDRLDAAYSSQLRFVSDASHELRTPIAVLQGYANMLDRWGKEDPAVLQESIEAIKAESEGMKVLVEQLLFLARGDNNTIELKVHPLDMSDCATEVLRDTKLIDNTHELVADIDHSLWVEGDGALLKQALRVLVDNAVKYSPAGGRITISSKAQDGWVRVSVTDNGIGIPEGDLAHVFERFYRSDESRARATGGTGLGLSIAYWIVQRHGGHMEVLSRQDLGTKMTILLPACEVPTDDIDQEEAI